MIISHSNFTCLAICLFYFVYSVFSFPVESNLIEQILLQNYGFMTDADSKENIHENSSSSPNTRVKRSQTFKDAGDTSQLKMLQQYLQLFFNFGAKKPMGGRHPLDPTVPHIAGRIIKTKLFGLLDEKS